MKVLGNLRLLVGAQKVEYPQRAQRQAPATLHQHNAYALSAELRQQRPALPWWPLNGA